MGMRLPDMEAVKLLCSQLIEYCSNLTYSDEPLSQEEADEYANIIMPFVAAFSDVNYKGIKQ